MNSKEIIFMALKREKTSRIPVAILSGGVWAFNRYNVSLEEALLKPETQCEIFEESNIDVKSDIVWAGSGYNNLIVKAIGGKIKFRKRGAPDVTETLIKNAVDIDKINLKRISEDEGINSLWKCADILKKDIGDKTLIGASSWGPFTLAGALYGVEKLMRDIYKDKNGVKNILEFTSNVCYELLSGYVKNGAELASIADPTASGDMISKKQFEEFSLPYLTKVVKGLKDIGAKTEIHICGDTTNRLELIKKSKADTFSMDYKVDISKARELLGEDMTFSGNMNPVNVMQNASQDEVRRICHECIQKSGIRGYILMPGCDIPHGVPIDNLKAMVETAHNYY